LLSLFEETCLGFRKMVQEKLSSMDPFSPALMVVTNKTVL
jgi:hypothetical protein